MWAKLSSVHDPFRLRRADEGSDDDREGDSEGDRDDDWIWEAEEDFTSVHIWPQGGDLSRDVTYHHTPTTQIHITINMCGIPGPVRLRAKFDLDFLTANAYFFSRPSQSSS